MLVSSGVAQVQMCDIALSVEPAAPKADLAVTFIC